MKTIKLPLQFKHLVLFKKENIYNNFKNINHFLFQNNKTFTVAPVYTHLLCELHYL